MAVQLPPPPNNPVSNSFEWREWFFKVYSKFTQATGISFSGLDFSGSNLNSIVTRDHNTLTNIQGGDSLNRYHLTAAEHTSISTLPTFGTMATQNANAVNITGGTITGISGLGMTYPGAGIANSTGSAWGTSYTTSGSGTVLALANGPTITLANGTGLPVGGITATGTPSSTTYLRGDSTWSTIPAGMVYPGAGIPNSTGSAWGTSYTTSGSGTVVALSDSPTFTTAITSTGALQLTGDATSTQNIATNMTTGTLNIGGNASSAINLNSPTYFSSTVDFSTATYVSDLTLGTAASPSALTVYGSSTFGTSAVPQAVFYYGSFNQSFGQCTFTGSAAGGIVFGSSQTTGSMNFGSASQTGAITLGQSTQTQTVNIATGVPASTKTKTVNIGTSATTAAGATNIAIGSTTGTSTTTINGYFKPPALASAPTYVKGAVYFDTTLNKLRVGGATTWETITSI